MKTELLNAVSSAVEKLMKLSGVETDVDAHLRTLATEILELTDVANSAPKSYQKIHQLASEAERRLQESSTFETVVRIKEETSSSSDCLVDSSDQAFFDRNTITDDDLPLIEKRCRMKADGSRWAAERRRRQQHGADFRSEIKPYDEDIKDRASEIPKCKLWMCSPAISLHVEPAAFECLADCFDNTANAISLVRTVIDEELGDELLQEAMSLLAEAQSALRKIVPSVRPGSDSDQNAVHYWLRAAGSTRHIYISKFMTADDLADPAGSLDLQKRIDAAHDSVLRICERVNARDAGLDKITLHLENLNDEKGEAHNIRKIVEEIDGLIDSSTRPSDSDLRKLLLPILPKLKDYSEPPKNLQLFLRETDKYLSSQTSDESNDFTERPTDEIQKVAKLLKGKTMVIVGGEPRPFARQALETAFGVTVDWIAAYHHQSVYAFENRISKPDVVVVLLLIRLSSHAFGDIERFCDAESKPLVRLSGGYNPQQVAVQILSQASNRLTPLD